jgi:hypothetical protein
MPWRHTLTENKNKKEAVIAIKNLINTFFSKSIILYIIKKIKKPVRILKNTAIKFARNIKLPRGIKVNIFPSIVFNGYPGGCCMPRE